MAIIQISKIQQRSGDLQDLPQLDEAEFGFASNEKLLFIGKESPSENIEVLTSYSNIPFSQLEGAIGNLNISANVGNGEVLTYDGNNWVNRGGDTGGLIDLGVASNVKIGGQASTGYVLQTDGIGNLSWSPKGIVSLSILEITESSNAELILSSPYPFPNVLVTINGIGPGDYATNLNAGSFYIDPVPGNLQVYKLYYSNLAPVDTIGYDPYPVNTGTLIFNTVTSNGAPAGAEGSIQFTQGSSFGAAAGFVFNAGTLSVPGPINVTQITTGANTTAGTITGNWTLTAGSRLQATYADLAEYYCADSNYAPGTVLDFGGEYEVTIAGIESNKIAGVVSSEPAYIMNSMLECKENAVPIALQGRVPCKVTGKVNKGDMMISAGNGYAKASIVEPKMGTVIGKALADFDGEEGVIEVVVGRL